MGPESHPSIMKAIWINAKEHADGNSYVCLLSAIALFLLPKIV